MSGPVYKCPNCGEQIVTEQTAADVLVCQYCGFEFKNPFKQMLHDVPVMQLQTSQRDHVNNIRNNVVKRDSTEVYFFDSRIIFCTIFIFIICAAAICYNLFFSGEELKFSKDFDSAVKNDFSYALKTGQKAADGVAYAIRKQQKDLTFEIVKKWDYEDYSICYTAIQKKGSNKKVMSVMVKKKNNDGYWIDASSQIGKERKKDKKLDELLNDIEKYIEENKKNNVSFDELLGVK